MISVISVRMRTPEASKYLGLSKSTLDKLRCFGGGPRYIKTGRRVLYDQRDLDSFLESHKRSSTSEYPHV
jgi:excisionase family DNA binding protein